MSALPEPEPSTMLKWSFHKGRQTKEIPWNWKPAGLNFMLGRNFSLWEWWGAGMSCAEIDASFQAVFTASWMRLWANWSSRRCSCLGQGCWNWRIFKLPSNTNYSITLWFCDGKDCYTDPEDTSPLLLYLQNFFPEKAEIQIRSWNETQSMGLHFWLFVCGICFDPSGFWSSSQVLDTSATEDRRQQAWISLGS